MGCARSFSGEQGTGADFLADVFATRGTEMRFSPSIVIEAQGHPVTNVYRIRRGSVRTCMYTEDGDRKVLQFLGPGDFLGLSGNPEWLASHEAVDTVIVDAMPLGVFDNAVSGSAVGQLAIRNYLAARINRYAALLVLTANSNAVDRVMAFLRDFARQRQSSGFVSLPMGRLDIADHLGLSMETVSRSMTTLRGRGEISMKGAAFFRINSETASSADGGFAHAA